MSSNPRLKYTTIFFSYFKSRFQLDVGISACARRRNTGPTKGPTPIMAHSRSLLLRRRCSTFCPKRTKINLKLER